MTDIFTLTIPPTGDSPSVAGGRITQTGELFRFEFEGGNARLFIYPSTGGKVNIESLCEFNQHYRADEAYLMIERNVGIGECDGRAGRTLVNGLLTHWLMAYLNGSLLPTDLEGLRRLATAKALQKAALQRQQEQQVQQRHDDEDMGRARLAIADLPQRLGRAALNGDETCAVWILSESFGRALNEGEVRYQKLRSNKFRCPKVRQLDAAARFVWDACQEYNPVIGLAREQVAGQQHSEIRMAINIVLRPKD